MRDTPKPVLGVDFDDVLMRAGDALAAFHNATYGTSYARDEVADFDLSKMWNCTPEEATRRIGEFMATEFHHEADPVVGAKQALEKLRDAYDIVIVTGRAEAWREGTVRWLEKNLLGLYREVHFTGQVAHDGGARRKSDIATELGIAVFIDDALHFAEDVASFGIPVLLFDTPWNRGQTREGVTRVHSWEEILGLLLPPGKAIS